MISSLASVLVANANATPENVVPWIVSMISMPVLGASSQNQCPRSIEPCFVLRPQPRLDVQQHAEHSCMACLGLAAALDHMRLHIQEVAVDPSVGYSGPCRTVWYLLEQGGAPSAAEADQVA